MVTSMQLMDEVFERHGYRLDRYAADGDDWCYNRRRTKNGTVWSLHSWAIAVDINATENPYSSRFSTTFTPQIIADIQALRHPNGRPVFQWGGTWGRNGGKFDTMHFQTSLTPEEAESLPGPAPKPIPRPTGQTPAVRPPSAPTAPRMDPTATQVVPPPMSTAQLGHVEHAVRELNARVERMQMDAEAVIKVRDRFHDRISRLEQQVEVLGAIVGGLDYWTLSEAMASTLLGREPEHHEIDVVAERLNAGEAPEVVYWSVKEELSR